MPILVLVRIFTEKMCLDNAAFYFDKVIKVDAENSIAHFFKGRSQHKLGLTREAMNSYDLAININPNYGEAYLYRGALNMHLNKRSSACNDFRLAQSLKIEDANGAIKRYCK